ncbi:MAG: L-seryl-tRNA(Sec) selenium transferase [Dehalococcoidales bacterium]|jgi:L-seryl-tRNA(Ser) seleniumtransferase|nr:L-seryl-tRNA(Sec) selenium transferase [Dehalococcoidales bacterium]
MLHLPEMAIILGLKITLSYNGDMEENLRRLPSVDKLLSKPEIQELTGVHGLSRDLVVELIRESLDFYRSEIKKGKDLLADGEIVARITGRAAGLILPSLKPVINATGVVLHTNLGRAPLSEEAVSAMKNISGVYNNLEFDLESGERGSRHTHLEPLLCRLTGAEAGLVVNNNAAAVLLGLSAIAKRKEVIVSRGQAVEIGGGFRIPEVMRQSGAKLVEVGTTNCTYIRDYEAAITPRTVALLRVHSSNFKVVGFTHMVTLEEMVSLGKQYNLLVLDDLGSGCPLDTTRYGLDAEPLIQDSVKAGADLVFFSGDKLLGGPQAGIIVGKKALIDKLKKHPLVRAMRVDKTRIAALAVTLLHHLKGEATVKIPVWQMISMPLEVIERRARQWAESLAGVARLIEGESVIGGGSLPGSSLPTWLVAIGDPRKPAQAQKLARILRSQEPPVIGRISENILLLDPRTVSVAEDEILIQAVQQALRQL